jgi:hypothetical protein
MVPRDPDPPTPVDAVHRTAQPAEHTWALTISPRLGEPPVLTIGRLVAAVLAVVGILPLADLTPVQGWSVLVAVTLWTLVPVRRVWPVIAGAAVAWLFGAVYVSEPRGVLTLDRAGWGYVAIMVFTCALAMAISRRAIVAAASRPRSR